MSEIPQEFYFVDVIDDNLKDIIPHLEHPIFTISKNADMRVLEYQHNGASIAVTPSFYGRANMYDKDVLIFCVSQLVSALHRGETVTETVRVHPRKLLAAIGRPTGGSQYKALITSLERLAGTRIKTTIPTGADAIVDGFNTIQRYTAKRLGSEENGRLEYIEITLSKWLFNAVTSHEVLTLHPDYFQLTKPLERRLYEIARKHCGSQKSWKIGLDLLQKKSGSDATARYFKFTIKQLVQANTLPDYLMMLDETDMVTFINRETMPKQVDVLERVTIPPLDPEIYDMARVFAQGWDVRHIEQVWRDWATEQPKNPEMAFLGFVKGFVKNNGSAQ